MKEKPKPKAAEIEELPDAWERFEKAFDTVMKAKPKPRSSESRCIHLRLNADAALAVIAEIKSEFDRDRLGDARERILGLLKRPEEAFRVETDVSAAGARKLTVRLNPSDRLIVLLTALRARDVDGLPVEKT
jgi:hypothetical protein